MIAALLGRVDPLSTIAPYPGRVGGVRGRDVIRLVLVGVVLAVAIQHLQRLPGHSDISVLSLASTDNAG